MDHPPSLSAGTVLWQLAAVLALVLANGFFVAAEFALVSVRKTRIDQLATEGNATAVAVQRALVEMDRHIAAAQVGITVVSLLLGSTGEKVLEPMFLPLLAWMPQPVLGITRTGIAFFLAYLVMTSMHVIIGEQLPKTMAIQKADSMSFIIVRPMMWFTWLCTPLVWVLNISVNFLLRLVGLPPSSSHAQVHSPEELDLLFQQSHEGGELNATEVEILHRVVRFSDVTVRGIMVPRVEMQAIPMEITPTALRKFLQSQPHTRVPVHLGTLDDLAGIAHLKDLLRFEASLDEPEGQETVKEAVKEVVAAPAGSDAQTPRAREGDGAARAAVAAVTAAEAAAAADAALHAAPGERSAIISGRAGVHDTAPKASLRPIVRDAPRVPETMTIDKLLLEFKRRRQQMAIVIDEYGGTAGLVTMGDLLEQVFGDVRDEFDSVEPDIVEHTDGTVEASGRVLIEDINDRFATALSSDDADTIAGLVLDVLGRPARVGDEVESRGVRLRVERVDRLRITRVRLQLPPRESDNGDAAAS